MRTFFAFFFVALMVITIIACIESSGKETTRTANNTKKPYPYEEAIKNGDVVNLYGKISHLEKFERFIGNVESGNEDKVRITMYTVEGDPIFYNLDFNGDKINYTFDTSQDAFAGSEKGKQITSCSKIEKAVTDKGLRYHLRGCSSEVGYTFDFLVEK